MYRDKVNARFRWRKHRFWLEELNYWINKNKTIKTWFKSGLYTDHVMMIRHQLFLPQKQFYSLGWSRRFLYVFSTRFYWNSFEIQCYFNAICVYDYLSQSPKEISNRRSVLCMILVIMSIGSFAIYTWQITH